MQPPQRSLAEAGFTFVLFLTMIVVSTQVDRQSGRMWLITALFLAAAPVIGFIRDRDKGDFAYLQSDDFLSTVHWILAALCSAVTGCIQLLSGLGSTELFWVTSDVSSSQLLTLLIWGVATLFLTSFDTIRSRQRSLFSRVAIAVLKNTLFLYAVIISTITIQTQHSNL